MHCTEKKLNEKKKKKMGLHQVISQVTALMLHLDPSSYLSSPNLEMSYFASETSTIQCACIV